MLEVDTVFEFVNTEQALGGISKNDAVFRVWRNISSAGDEVGLKCF